MPLYTLMYMWQGVLMSGHGNQYMPHRGRVSPSQDDTLQDLHKVLTKVTKNDYICILGDLNEQLTANIQDALHSRNEIVTPGRCLTVVM